MHHLRSAHQELAHFAGGQIFAGVQVHHLGLGVGNGQADGARHLTPAQGIDVGHRAGLGQSVSLHQPPPGQPLEGFFHFDGKGGRSADAGPNGRKTKAPHARVIVDGGVHGGHAGEESRLVAFDGLQHLLGGKCGQQHDGRRQADAHVHTGGHAIGVRKGEHSQHHLFALLHVGEPVANLNGVGHQVVVREHNPLGLVGGAAGILDKGQVVG